MIFSTIDGAVFKTGKNVRTADNYSSGEFTSARIQIPPNLTSGGGYVAEFNKNFDFEGFAKSLNAKKVAEFKNGDNDEFYYYSDEVAGFVVVSGRKINLHFVREKGRIVAGVPFIYTGY